MKRVFLGLVTVLLLSAVGFLGQTAEAQGRLNSFVIKSYNIDYTLSRDADKRSTLKAVETITADFANRGVNHGIERAIPNEYKGHTTKLKLNSVVDEHGNSVQHSTYKQDDTTVFRIGNPDAYAYGLKTYVITYTQQDVTHYFENTQSTEWYWDTNGTGWKVPIENMTVSVKMDDAIRAELKGVPRCYWGYANSTNQCDLYEKNGMFSMELSHLYAGQNATVAFGFAKDTFAAYQQSLFDKFIAIWQVAFFVSAAVVTGLIAILGAIYSKRRNRTKELNIIPTEYIPPRDVSVTTSAQIVITVGSVFGAQLIDFAVRHFIEIVETREKTRWRSAEYEIHIIKDVTQLLSEEQEILSDMFGHTPQVGERLALKSLRSNYAYTARTIDNDAKLGKLIVGEYGIRHAKAPAADKAYFRRWGVTLLIIAVATLMPMLLIPSIIAFVMGATIKPLTDKGLELRRYILGLNKYIKAAETERIKMLQGPDTAEKIGVSVDPNNPGQLVKLYERTLPYAVLLGHEREWTKRLGEFYTQAGESPDWYSGNSAFNALAFSSAISSFSTSVSTYSGSSSSSGSGGSSGGGSSGGGGGGGGGGGW